MESESQLLNNYRQEQSDLALDNQNEVAQTLFHNFNGIIETNPFVNTIMPSNYSIKNYTMEYQTFKEKITSFPDEIKTELNPVFFPIFIHIFLEMIQNGYYTEAHHFFSQFQNEQDPLYQNTIKNLISIVNIKNIENNMVACTYLSNRVLISLSIQSHLLLMKVLNDHPLLLRIILRNINFSILKHRPSSYVPTSSPLKTYSSSSLLDNQINSQNVQKGLLSPFVDIYREVFQKPNSDLNIDQKDKHNIKSLTPSIRAKKKSKIKKTQTHGLHTILSNPIPITHDKSNFSKNESDSTLSLPLPPISPQYLKQYTQDLIYQDHLSSSHLPSIAFFTFLNSKKSFIQGAINYEGNLIAGGYSDGVIRLWDLKKYQQTNDSRSEESSDQSQTHLIGHNGSVYGVSFSPDSQPDFLLSAGADQTIRLWSVNLSSSENLPNRKNLVIYRGHNYPIWDVSFSPLGFYFASASHDTTARFWSTDRLYPLRVFCGHTDDVIFHPNSLYVLTGSHDHNLRLWDINSQGNCVRLFQGHTQMISSIAISPNGQLAASGSYDQQIIIWDIGTGREISRYKCQSPIYSLSFSFDLENIILAAGLADNQIQLFDIQDTLLHTPLKIFPTKGTPVTNVTFTRRNLLCGLGPFRYKYC